MTQVPAKCDTVTYIKLAWNKIPKNRISAPLEVTTASRSVEWVRTRRFRCIWPLVHAQHASPGTHPYFRSPIISAFKLHTGQVTASAITSDDDNLVGRRPVSGEFGSVRLRKDAHSKTLSSGCPAPAAAAATAVGPVWGDIICSVQRWQIKCRHIDCQIHRGFMHRAFYLTSYVDIIYKY